MAKIRLFIDHPLAQGQGVALTPDQAHYLGGVMRLTPEGLVAVEIMPGIEPARDIVAASQGRVRLAPDARPMPLSLLAEGPMELAL